VARSAGAHVRRARRGEPLAALSRRRRPISSR
jgi:hypothetical protein